VTGLQGVSWLLQLERGFAAKVLAFGLMMSATPAFAQTTLVCDLEPNSLLVQDSSTILTLDESAQTIGGKFGAYHYSDPTFQGSIREESLPRIPATFTDQEIVFTAPPAFAHATAGDKFHLSRLTGELQHFSADGYRVGDLQRCHSATKQF
jgi:hypothetical protein